MFWLVTGNIGGKGRKMMRKMQNIIAMMLIIKPNLPNVHGPNLIGLLELKRRIANMSVGMAYEK